MASKHFTETRIQDKEQVADKLELQEKLQKDHKDQKDAPDNKQKHEKEKQEKDEQGEQTTKNQKDDKDAPDAKHKQEKDKHEKEKEHKAEKDGKDHSKVEHKDHPFETVRQEFIVASNPMPGAPASNPMPGSAQPFFGPGMGWGAPKPLTDKPKEVFKELFDHKASLKELHLEVKHVIFETQPRAHDPLGPVEQRLQALESTVGQLLHFIPQNLRPDLSQGALKQEADVAAADAAQAEKTASGTTRRRKKKATAQG